MEVRERPLSTRDLAKASDAQDESSRSAEADAAHKEKSAIPLQGPAAREEHDDLAPLFSHGAVEDFRSQWTALQTGFVDEPRRSVEQADELVARLMKDLAATFSDERAKLEKQWDKGDKVSTEELRLVLRRYRSFFDRFLSI